MTDLETSGLAAGVLVTVAVGLVPAVGATRGPAWQQGREPAQTMSYRGAPWLERAERAEEERPDEVLDAMGLEAGDVVADIGAGSGYFARRMARRVGEQGKVYGVDIQPEMLEILADNARAEGITNIEPVLGDPDDPNLPASSVDWMLLVDVYHEIAEPEPMLARMREALEDDGRIALLEYRLEDASGDHIFADHRMSVRQVLEEWRAAGFALVDLLEFLPSQHMFIFRKADSTAGAARPAAASLDDVDLIDAQDRGLVSIEARGGGRDSVSLQVRRRGDRRLLLTLPAGTLLEAVGEHRDMVTMRDAYLLLDGDSSTVEVRAAGTRWDKPTASRSDRFEIRAANPESSTARVARAVQAGTYRASVHARRASYAPQSVSTAEAALWIAVHDAGFDEVERHLGDSEVPAVYAAAFGLVYGDRAGLDVTSTRMWAARQAIFGRLQLADLEAWYAARRR